MGPELYPIPTYPAYMIGHSYVIAGSVIGELLEAARRLPLIPVEDAYVTGLLARMARVPQLHVDNMAASPRSVSRCDLMRGKYVSETHFNATSLAYLWRVARAGGCGTVYD